MLRRTTIMNLIGLKLNGRYQILDHLGEGATSTVYKGMDTLLGRIVALKVLLPHVRETTRKRFFQEAMAAAQLNHPNIMAIYDRGDDDGRSFLVIEFVDGDSLTHFIPSASETVIMLGAQIANALDYAHERDIIHRDIKPANIKVTKEGQVKIMDLGLALPREAQRVTTPGMVIGTPAYISPEQAQGQALDRRTDIYSLGIVLYEMATGQLPFNADDITALLLQHVQQPAPSPRLIVPELSRGLESVILKTLEKKADRRFQNGRALAESLYATLPAGATQEAPTAGKRPDWAKNIKTDRLKEPAGRKKTIRVVIADDHTLLRRTLSSYLESHDEFVVIAESGDGDTALSQTVSIQPDILILDLNMPGKGGLDVMPEIRAKAPNTKILVLTGRDDDLYIMRALRSGANGYILKSTDEQKLLESIRKVLEGEIVMGKGIAEKVVTGLLTGKQESTRLNENENNILLYIAKGYNDEQIARMLNLSMTQLVEALASVMQKTGGRDRNAAALRAISSGMIILEDLHNLPAPPVE
jgi:serine/threonine protein kinase/DNA-binding CsgD family transcriptional regulator